MPNRSLPVAFVLVSLSSCSACAPHEQEVLAELTTPVSARVVWSRDTDIVLENRHHGFETTRKSTLHVSGRTPERLPEAFSDDTPLELVADATGARLAYRETGGEWRVAYLPPSSQWTFVSGETLSSPLRDRLWRKVTRSRGDAPDWSSVPTFLEAAPALAMAHERKYAGQGTAGYPEYVFEAVWSEGGSAAAASLLIATLDGKHWTYPPWTAAFHRLPTDERERVLAALRERIIAGDSDRALGLALQVLPVPDPATARALLGIARKAVDSRERLPFKGAHALRLGAEAAPDEAKAVACEALASGHDDPLMAGTAYYVLAKARATCPSAEAAFERLVCGGPTACSSRPGPPIEAWETLFRTTLADSAAVWATHAGVQCQRCRGSAPGTK